MAVTLILRDTKSGLVLASPVPGDLMEISLYGARLSVTHIRTGNCHLFYTCNDDQAKVIQIEVIDREGEEGIAIPAQPVWFDHVLSSPAKHFELGMEFLVPPEDPNVARLHALLDIRPSRKGSWLKRFFRLG